MAGSPHHYTRHTKRNINIGHIVLQVVSCALFSAACPAFSQSPAEGPFIQRDQFIIRMLFLGLRPESGKLLPSNSKQWTIRFDYANTYASTRPLGNPAVADEYYQAAPLNEYRQFLDVETLRIALDLDWRITSRFQMGLTLPFLRHGGGFLDRPVEGFHRLFNLTNGGREDTPQNNYSVYVVRNNRFWLKSAQSAAIQQGDLVVRIKTPLYRWQHVIDLALASAVKLPTGSLDALTGSGGFDIQMALFATWRPVKALVFHYNISHSRLGKPTRHEGFPLRPITTQMLALEYRGENRYSALIQVQSNTGPFPESVLGPLDRTAFEISMGAKYGLSKTMTLEFGITENISQFHNTPDIGFHAGVFWRKP